MSVTEQQLKVLHAIGVCAGVNLSVPGERIPMKVIIAGPETDDMDLDVAYLTRPHRLMITITPDGDVQWWAGPSGTGDKTQGSSSGTVLFDRIMDSGDMNGPFGAFASLFLA